MKSDSLQKLFDKIDKLDSSTLPIFARRLWAELSSLRNVMNVVREGIIVIDELGTIDFFNNAASDIIGIEKNTSVGDCIWKYIPTVAQTFQKINKEKIAAESVFMQEVIVSYPRHMCLRINIIPFVCEKTDECKFVIIILDITRDRQSTEKQIENERFSSIMLLASGVAHEIGNPLNSISLRIHIMQKQLKQMKNSQEIRKLQQSVDVCLAEISRLDGIIKNFLQAIRPTNLALEEVSINGIINEVKTILEPELLNNNISIDIDSDTDHIIVGDKTQLKQVLFNIIKNGAESMSQGGTISINISETESNIEVSVKDKGQGISTDIIDKIFQPYFSTKSTGNGLGLLIVERILREHGAQLDINSTVGEGTEMLIKFQKKDIKVPLLTN